MTWTVYMYPGEGTSPPSSQSFKIFNLLGQSRFRGAPAWRLKAQVVQHTRAVK